MPAPTGDPPLPLRGVLARFGVAGWLCFERAPVFAAVTARSVALLLLVGAYFVENDLRKFFIWVVTRWNSS